MGGGEGEGGWVSLSEESVIRVVIMVKPAHIVRGV